MLFKAETRNVGNHVTLTTAGVAPLVWADEAGRAEDPFFVVVTPTIGVDWPASTAPKTSGEPGHKERFEGMLRGAVKGKK